MGKNFDACFKLYTKITWRQMKDQNVSQNDKASRRKHTEISSGSWDKQKFLKQNINNTKP